MPGWFFPFLLNKDRRVASQADRRLEEQSPRIRIQPSHERKLPPSRHLCISRYSSPRILDVIGTTTVVIDLRMEKIDLSTELPD